ncbi:hypothetical protein ACIRCZ_18900 [Leifsonia sp. NPDC102414]|uniref:hypothetical protein n=1 Tax=Leifsonia sp. NPDC102414 TaxID=3364124 RepID=UPI003815DFBE
MPGRAAAYPNRMFLELADLTDRQLQAVTLIQAKRIYVSDVIQSWSLSVYGRSMLDPDATEEVALSADASRSSAIAALFDVLANFRISINVDLISVRDGYVLACTHSTP